MIAAAVDTGTRIPRPVAWKRAPLTRPADPAVLVRPHPSGGWTHAVSVNGGTARVYVGHFETARAAVRALSR